MKKRLSLFIIFLLSSFFLYFLSIQKKSSTNLWDIVPSKSAIIFELEEPNIQWKKIVKKLNESKFKLSFNGIIKDYDDFNDFIDGRIEEFLTGNKIIISYFNLSNKILKPVYISYKKNLDQNFIIKKLEEKEYDLIERKLDGKIIYEAKKNGKNHIFSFFDNIIIYSSKSIIIEDVITTGKSSLECSQLVNSAGAKIVGYACIIDRSNGQTSIKEKIVSQVKLDIPTYTEDNLPESLSSIEAVKPGSRNL